ncbi:MAG: type I 3-dehydroquinate dehydratase [Candidatus Micrarchaeota archaeon]|nr:type I 3-dehydroquinate dehydratase [Candidatus Micrarchaeota archaeon]
MTLVCVPVTARTVQQALKAVARASCAGDVVELRLDCLKDPAPSDVEKIISRSRAPVTITNRPAREGGFFTGPENKRIGLLEDVLRSAAFVDVELSTPPALRKRLVAKAKKARTKVIISFHDTKRTPEYKALAKILDEEKKAGADIMKIITTACAPGDNIKLLELYEYAGKKRAPLAAWAMGEQGKPSRFLAIASGAPLAFASLKGMESAPGQLTLKEAKDFIKALKKT